MVRIGADFPRLACEKATCLDVVEPVELASPVVPMIMQPEPERIAEKSPLPGREAPAAPVAAEPALNQLPRSFETCQ